MPGRLPMDNEDSYTALPLEFNCFRTMIINFQGQNLSHLHVISAIQWPFTCDPTSFWRQ